MVPSRTRIPLLLPPFTNPSPSSATTTSDLAPAIPSPSCSHHLLATHAPDLRNVYSQRSIIGHVAMYSATIFCLFRTYAPISSNLASSISISIGRYSQLPSTCRFGCIHIIRLETLC